MPVQCVGNNAANCGTGAAFRSARPPASSRARRSSTAIASRPATTGGLYNGYIQDSFSRGRWRLNGGLRYDWQQRVYLGGCVPASILVPDLLPAQCEGATQTDVTSGGEDPAVQQLVAALSATYDLFGTGKTQIHASGSHFYNTRITLANALNGLGLVSLTWGTNQSSGVQHDGERPRWTDANMDGTVQRNELIGQGIPRTAAVS